MWGSGQLSKHPQVTVNKVSVVKLGEVCQPRTQSLRLLHSSTVNASKINPKQKHVVELKDTELSKDSISNEAYELMVKETPPSNHWKEVEEEQWNLSVSALQQNETVHENIEAKEEQITKLREENEEPSWHNKSGTCLEGTCLGKDQVKEYFLSYRNTRKGQEQEGTSGLETSSSSWTARHLGTHG
uniref:Uncharacterized protein n=1 Tax=Salarias fasciatus TaxID=181472 RepID=A0A672HXV4_SALFA